jgi:hypothetical protein
MSCLAHNERRSLLQPYLENARANWAHVAIAAMVKAGLIARILAFNFDSVLARAFGQAGFYPATYDFTAAGSPATDYLPTPAVVHLHGQGFALKMLNSNEETEKHANDLQPLIQQSFYQAPFLVIVYSGQSDAVFPVIEKAFTGAERLIWAGYQEEADTNIRNLLKKGGNTAEYLGGADADLFLIDLARALECFPPPMFEDSYGYLLEELESLTEFPMSGNNEVDILRNLRKKLKTDQESNLDDQQPHLELCS